MARKQRIHYPGAVYHVILRGNSSQDIFFANADRRRFYLLLQEGVGKYHHRIHAFCLMSNHVHLAVQVADIPLSRIMHNLGFRYTRYINWRKNRTGHLFQGRYKALLINADSYLLELVRYIHCNPVRAGLSRSPHQYPWSSHRAYLGEEAISWLSTDWILSQFASQDNRARTLYADFIGHGLHEGHRCEFHKGSAEGRILGEDIFSEQAFARAAQQFQGHLDIEGIISAVCSRYGITPKVLVEPGKKQPAALCRAIAAYLVQGADNITMTELGRYVGRDLAALSRAAERIRIRSESEADLAKRIAEIRQDLGRISKCQA